MTDASAPLPGSPRIRPHRASARSRRDGKHIRDVAKFLSRNPDNTIDGKAIISQVTLFRFRFLHDLYAPDAFRQVTHRRKVRQNLTKVLRHSPELATGTFKPRIPVSAKQIPVLSLTGMRLYAIELH
jgi:hypothetical protein